jgi:hypothetical protein
MSKLLSKPVSIKPLGTKRAGQVNSLTSLPPLRELYSSRGSLNPAGAPLNRNSITVQTNRANSAYIVELKHRRIAVDGNISRNYCNHFFVVVVRKAHL